MYNSKINSFDKMFENMHIESGLQKYQYIVDCDIIIGIECLICGTISYNPKNVNEQWCNDCEIYHFTPT